MNNTEPSSRLLISDQGTVSFVWSDNLAGFLECGNAHIHRASHVEPVDTPDGPQWVADMSPSGGPVLGPFRLRDVALEAEREWLSDNKGL